jgi:hypothetical protein
MTAPQALTGPAVKSVALRAPQLAVNARTVSVLRARGLGKRELAEALAGKLELEQHTPADRALIGELWAQADAYLKASDQLEDCGRAWVQYECHCGHIAHLPYACSRPALCPMCAASESAKRVRIYEGRVLAALAKTPSSVRLRVVTLSLKQHEDEELRDAFTRCRDAAKTVYRLLWGVPRTGAEWRQYFELFPLSRRAVKAAGSLRAARSARRRLVKRQSKQSGVVVSIEYGAKGMKAHAHMLVVGRYVHHTVLKKAWQLVTGDSFIQHIAARGTIEQRVREGLKYVTKFAGRSAGELVDVWDSTLTYGENGARSRRRVESLGILRGKVPGESNSAPLCCDTCGEPMRAVGVIQPSLWAMGVRTVADEARFRGRAPPD